MIGNIFSLDRAPGLVSPNPQDWLQNHVFARTFALLAQKFKMGNATVTICHTGTQNIKKHTIDADILIAAAGCPEMIVGNMIKEGVDIIDVGINRVSDDSKKGYTLVGDVNTASVLGKANSVTPVPGGVGPLTISMLIHNTVTAAKNN